MSSPSEVSVIIVSTNCRKLLLQTLESLYQHDHACEFETILVDNASSDGTIRDVERYFPEVQTLPLTQNIGFGAANNLGYARAKGDFLLFLNPDTIVLPNTIANMLPMLREHRKLGCVGPRHLNGDGSLQRSMNAFPTLYNDFLELSGLANFTCIQRHLEPNFPWFEDHDRTRLTGWVNGACMLFRREAFEDAGGFDESYFVYVEEVDLCHTLRLQGWDVLFTPDAEIIHLEGKTLDSKPEFRVRLRFWGHCHYYDKFHAGWKALTFRGLISIVAGVRVLGLVLLGVSSALGYHPSQRAWELVMLDHGRGTSIFGCAWIWTQIMFHADIADSNSRKRCLNLMPKQLPRTIYSKDICL